MPVVTRGPFFDARRTRYTNDLCEDIAEETAERARFLWGQNMRSTFRQPTPIYWNTTNVELNGNVALVNDGGRARGLVYGPWLEGTGSRNRTTRFKGYFNLRKAAQQTRQQVRAIAAPLLARYYRRMNTG